MKSLFIGKVIFVHLLIIPLSIPAQEFNNIYDFGRKSYNSEHTCMDELSPGRIAVAHTVDGFSQNRHVSLMLVNSNSGNPGSVSYEYRGEGYSTIATDLIQSMSDPFNAVLVGSYPPFSATPNIAMVVFDASPRFGTVSWAIRYGDQNTNLTAIAITKDIKSQTYYLLGEYEYFDIDGYQRAMYVCAFDKNGVSRFETYYVDPVKEGTFSPADILYDERMNELVIVGQYYNDFGTGGAVIATLDPNDGKVIKAMQITKIAGLRDFEIKDMSIANDKYVLVGDIKQEKSPTIGFLLQFEPELKPYISFSKIYTAGRSDISFSGIRQENRGELFVSFDYDPTSPVPVDPFPGLLELNIKGDVKSSYIYRISNYDYSVGLDDVFKKSGFIIKGVTKEQNGLRSMLSLVSVHPPMINNEDICSKEVLIKSYSGAEIEEFVLKAVEKKTDKKVTMTVNNGTPDVNVCRVLPGRNKNSIATSIQNINEEIEFVSVYPNPTTGQVNVSINGFLDTEQYVVEIYGMVGELVKKKRIVNKIETIDIGGENSGIYLIRVKNSQGKVLTNDRIALQY